jgi:hypothetical protein
MSLQVCVKRLSLSPNLRLIGLGGAPIST